MSGFKSFYLSFQTLHDQVFQPWENIWVYCRRGFFHFVGILSQRFFHFVTDGQIITLDFYKLHQ